MFTQKYAAGYTALTFYQNFRYIQMYIFVKNFDTINNLFKLEIYFCYKSWAFNFSFLS